MNIAFIGCGKLGMPCAEEIVKAGHSVTGYDVAKVTSDLVDIKDTIAEAVKFAKIVFVAVPTPHDPSYDGRAPTAHLEPKDFSYDIVKDVLRECDSVMNPAQMIVLISTVLPGTVRRELEPLVTNTRFVYNPYLIAMGSVAWDFVNPEMVMIGTKDGDETGDARELVNFYKTVIKNDPRYVVGTWDECECIKVFYNTFISTKLGLANMIQDVAMKQGNINVDVVTTALAESTKRIMGPQYMTAGMGDGGACHPRDNIALRFMAKELNLGYDIFDAIMNAREIQAQNLAEFLVAQAKLHDLPVLIHGEAYKPNVPYKDGSYSLLVAHYCEQLGYHPIMVDPHTSPQRGPFKAVALLAHSSDITYKYMDTVHKQELYCHLSEGSIVVDPWRRFEDERYKVIHYGNTRSLA
jgi:UDPglucose 6-dehydrogenase